MDTTLTIDSIKGKKARGRRLMSTPSQQDKSRRLYFQRNIYRTYDSSAEENPYLLLTWDIFGKQVSKTEYRIVNLASSLHDLGHFSRSAELSQTSDLIDYLIRDSDIVSSWSSNECEEILKSDNLYHNLNEQALLTEWKTILSPKLRTQRFERAKFLLLYNKWKKDTVFYSSMTDIAIHPAYQQIIGMGKSAIPFIFEQLSKNVDLWFWALKSITGEDPVLTEHRGKINDMAKDWLNWGKAKGYEY